MAACLLLGQTFADKWLGIITSPDTGFIDGGPTSHTAVANDSFYITKTRPDADQGERQGGGEVVAHRGN